MIMVKDLLSRTVSMTVNEAKKKIGKVAIILDNFIQNTIQDFK